MPLTLTLTQIHEEEPYSLALECEYAFTNKDKSNLRIVECEEMEQPIVSRIYAPFPLEVFNWIQSLNKQMADYLNNDVFCMGIDADGREYLEY